MKLIQFVNETETDGLPFADLLASMLNMRFTAFAVKMANNLEMDPSDFMGECSEILKSADILQDDFANLFLNMSISVGHMMVAEEKNELFPCHMNQLALEGAVKEVVKNWEEIYHGREV